MKTIAQTCSVNGVARHAVRLAKLGLDNGISGTLGGPSAYLMKSPPKQYDDDAARDLTEQFIRKHQRTRAKEPAKSKA